jgi:SP family facilitated glucose transporter-like MFS transporter 1
MFGSSFLFGYNIGVLNQPVELIQDFYNETYIQRKGEVPSESWIIFLWSLTTTLYLPGGMIGAFAAGFVADKIGRKKAILFSHLFAFGGAVISCCCLVAKAPELLMFGRFVTGINCGFATQLAPMYLAEIAPFSVRGGIGTGHQLFITVGIFVGSVLGLREILGTASLWPYLLLFNALPALFSLILLPFVPESPRYTMLNCNNRKSAEKALRWYRQRLDVMADIEEMETESQEGQKSEEEYTMKQLLTTKALHMPLLVACMLQVIQQLSGINAVFFYSTGIYENAGVSKPSIQYAVIGTNAVNVLMTVIAVPIMDKLGRRPLLLYPMVAMVFTLGVITMSLNLQPKFYWMGYLSVLCFIFYVICFAIGLGPIPVMIGAELFRQGPRPRAMSLAGLCNWFFTILVAISFESIQKLAKEFTFLIFLVLMIFFTVFVFFKVPETKNKTFEEIASQFQPGTDIEVVEEIMDEDDVFDDQFGVNSHLVSEKERMRNGSATSVDSKKSADEVKFSLPEEKQALTKSEQNLQNLDV